MVGKPFRTRLIRIGNSLGIRLPQTLLARVDLSTRLPKAGEVGPEVELTVEGEAIIVRPYRGVGPSFEERVALLLESVSAAPVEAQDLVLQAIMGTVDWLARAKRAQARLVPIIKDVYRQHKQEIENLKWDGQRLWERPDLLWYLLVHRVLTSQSDVAEDPSLSYQAVANLVLSGDDPASKVGRILGSRGGAVIHVQGRAEALVRCYELIASSGGLEAQTEKFRELTSKRDMEQFLRQFESDLNGQHFEIYGVYDPLDHLYIPAFDEHLTVTGEMHTLLEKLQLPGFYILSPLQPANSQGTNGGNGGNGRSVYERFFGQVAQQVRITPWELEQVIGRYYNEISHRLEEQFAVGAEDRPAQPPK